MRYEIRPLHNWIGPVTPARQRQRSRFKAAWSATLTQLGSEVEKLGASMVVLEMDTTDQQIRRDGMLRAAARVDSSSVRVSFESRYGPLQYATDTFDHWQDNVRAIVLSLEALRAVDRYGVSRRGEQYRGWNAIDSKPAVMTVEQAAEFISHWANNGRFPATQILTDPEVRDRALKAAALRAHPDRGGDNDTMGRLSLARELLKKRNGS